MTKKLPSISERRDRILGSVLLPRIRRFFQSCILLSALGIRMEPHSNVDSCLMISAQWEGNSAPTVELHP